MQMAESDAASRFCISSIRNSAPIWLAWATSPISRKSSARSCSGSPESATPDAASTSSRSSTAPGRAMLKALTTESARSIRCLARCRRLMFISSRAAMRAKVARKSAFEPTSWTSVVAQPASLRQDVELHEEHGLAHAAEPGVDEAALVGAGVEPLDQRLEALEVLVPPGQGAGLAPCSRRVGVVPLVHGCSRTRSVSKLDLREIAERATGVMGSFTMTVVTASDVYYDPYDVEINADPYPVFRRLREEAPLYYNEQYDFYAVSRLRGRRAGAGRPDTFSSARGGILEMIKANIEMPPGVFIFEDPPHPHHAPRAAVARVHAEADDRARAADPRVLRPQPRPAGRRRTGSTSSRTSARRCRCGSSACCWAFPRQDQEAVRRPGGRGTAHRAGQADGDAATDRLVERRSVVRRLHRLAGRAPLRRPHDRAAPRRVRGRDGTMRRLTREEILTYISVIAGAGNETTTRLIGWAGKVLAEHPDQRRELVEDRTLIPNAIEELLRFEPPGPQSPATSRATSSSTARRCPRAAPCCSSSARRTATNARSPDADRFDIHRRRAAPHLRLRHPLLPGRRAGPARGPDRAGRGAEALPRVGGRLRQRQAGVDLDGARLGDAPRLHLVNHPAADPGHR